MVNDVKSTCPDCHGSGFDPDAGTDANPEMTCRTCDGDGLVEMIKCVRCEQSVPEAEVCAMSLCRDCRVLLRANESTK